MRRYLLFLLVLLTLLSGLTVTTTHVVHAASTSKCINPGGTNTLHGTLQGANYTIEVPANWNGTLALYSHGYVFADQPLLNPAPDAPDPLSGTALLQQGYALAGSSFSQNGWALQQAFHDQIALLDFFNQTCGTPTRTIAWGQSLGGIITAGLVQLNPDRFTAALPMCGVLAGGIGTWNQALDGAFAFNVLLARNSLPLVHITNPTTALLQASTILDAAQLTSQGRARIALTAALTDLPGWFDPASPESAQSDFTAQENNQYLWMSVIDFAFAFEARAELEGRAGGNFSWNTNVDYSQQLGNSVDRDEVAALYKQAGLDLNKDLHTLASTARIKADPAAEAYLNKYITFNGNLRIPVLTAHTTGDGLVVNQEEQAYASVVSYQGNSGLLRQIFVHRAGHCAFTPAETLTAFQTLISRLDNKAWGNSTDPALLNQKAAALGLLFNPAPPAFIAFQPSVFLRPFDVRNHL
ncbi:MAG: prolyl oligopeptidase family serine peptidase [Ktedonobacteraceae bacterium]|nr:prolyl oligopeptidase family serine peptidase [Ktedonobacteraceae bacterium]